MKNENIMIKIDEKNFPDVNFRNWLLKQDYATDGVLTEEILSEITEMDVHGCAIHSLKGIEHFTALTKLNCSMNRLTSLDVSHCPALKVLDCFINDLAYLDLSHNPELTELNCSGNPLVSFDVSHNSALVKLNCSCINSLSLDLLLNGEDPSPLVLDLSHNPALRVLECSTNILKSLDLSHNPALRVLDCSCNELSSLDLSHNPALVKLNCCWNIFTSLDLSHNPALTILDCYDYNQGCEAATDALITNLPQTDSGIIYVGKGYSREKIKAAGAKGWVMQEGPQAMMSFYTYKNAGG